MIAFTVTSMNYKAVSNLLRSLEPHQISGLRPSTEGTASSAARFEAHIGNDIQTWEVSLTYTQAIDAINVANMESGALATSALVTSVTGSSTDAEVPSAKLLYDQLALKINTSAKDATGGVAGLTLFKLNLKNNANTYTSTLANTNTAARAYTLPDVAGGILVGAKIATTALTAGVLAVTVAGASTTSTAVVMTVALGGTVAAGGYKVACTTNTVTITALQADGTTTETGCTSTVQGICIL